MRNETTIREELGAAIDAYQARAHDKEAVWRPLSDKVRDLRKELSDAIAKGSTPCETCGAMPVGLKHLRHLPDLNLTIEIWELGCPVCPTRAIDTDRAEAVAKWNRNEYHESPDRVQEVGRAAAAKARANQEA